MHNKSITDPLRVSPETQPIPERYVTGVLKLSQKSRDLGVSADSESFVVLRNCILQLCETWRIHDWPADEAKIKAMKEAVKDHKDLKAAIIKLRREMRRSPDRKASMLLGQCIQNELFPGIPVKKSKVAYQLAVTKALNKFQRLATGSQSRRCRYGPLEYGRPPLRLPRPQVVFATALADRISFWRRDENRKGSAWSGSPPVLSLKLPWSAISSLASAVFYDGEGEIEPREMETLVRSHSKRVSGVFPFK